MLAQAGRRLHASGHAHLHNLNTKTHLADEGGLATHVGPCDELKPGIALDKFAVILNEINSILRLYAWMPDMAQLCQQCALSYAHVIQALISTPVCQTYQPCWLDKAATPQT